MIAALPMRGKGAKDLVEFRIRGGRFGEGKGFAAGELENFAIAEWIGDVKAEVAGLACAEKFAGAAKKKVGFGDFEAVGSADHGFKACFGVFVHVARSYEYAMRFCGAAAYASAQLVELRKAKPLRVFNDHDAGVGHVHADFDDGCGDEDLYFVEPELDHDDFFFFAGEAAM